MMNLVKFEQKYAPIYINPEAIKFIKEDDEEGFTYISLGDKGWAIVKEPIEDVLAKLCVNDCIKLIK